MIYFLYGANAYALRQQLTKLRTSFVEQYGNHGVESVDGESYDVARLPELLQGMSLFSAQRFVVLKQASSQKRLWELIGEWVDRIPAEITIVIYETAPDKRTKTFKLLTKHATIITAEPLTESAAMAWVVAESKKRGGDVGKKEARLLIDRIGYDQDMLSSELDKLIVHGTVTEELVRSVTEASPQATAFELLDAVLGRHVDKAGRILQEIKNTEDPYKLFGLFISQVYALALVVTSGHKTTQAVAADSGVHGFVISKLQKNKNVFSWNDVETIIEESATLDDQLKSTGADPWDLLETMLMKLASR